MPGKPAPRPPDRLETLDEDNLWVMPQQVDWSWPGWADDIHGWSVVYGVRCESRIQQLTTGGGGGPHSDLLFGETSCAQQLGHPPQPIGERWPIADVSIARYGGPYEVAYRLATRKAMNPFVCLVRDWQGYYLAFTEVRGLELQDQEKVGWLINAYVTLGSLPPFLLASDLQRFSETMAHWRTIRLYAATRRSLLLGERRAFQARRRMAALDLRDRLHHPNRRVPRDTQELWEIRNAGQSEN